MVFGLGGCLVGTRRFCSAVLLGTRRLVLPPWPRPPPVVCNASQGHALATVQFLETRHRQLLELTRSSYLPLLHRLGEISRSSVQAGR